MLAASFLLLADTEPPVGALVALALAHQTWTGPEGVESCRASSCPSTTAWDTLPARPWVVDHIISPARNCRPPPIPLSILDRPYLTDRDVLVESKAAPDLYGSTPLPCLSHISIGSIIPTQWMDEVTPPPPFLLSSAST